MRPGAEVHAQLSVLYEKLGKRAAAITHLQDALRMADTPTLHERLGYLYAGNGSYASAAREFEQATPPRRPGLWHVHIAELYAKAGDRSSELAHLDLAAAEPLEPASRRYVERQRGFLYSQLGDTGQSIEAWRAAVAAGLDDSAIHLDLGFALLQLQRWDAARAEFLRSNEREPSPRTLYYIAQCYRKLEQPDIAINYLKLAERDAQRLDPSTRKALYDELGFGYSAEGKELEAAAAWRNSLGVRYDAPIALKLALAERRLGHTDEAETTARAIPYAELTVPQHIMRAELIAEILEGKRQFSGARAALMEADELLPTAEHAYRLGFLAQRAGNDSQAVNDYEKAVAREPDNPLYSESLAYAHRRAGRTKQAEEIFERIVARFPDRVAAYRELAYTQLALGRQNDAATTLRQGIDAQLATTPPSEGERASEALPAMRAEYETLARRFATTVYESYRPNGGPAVGGTFNGGVIPSAGGAELSYFPAGALSRSDAA
ncbi:MAG: tetratricopeptide repeat protein, partial [Gammaproteobacteria bacterium]